MSARLTPQVGQVEHGWKKVRERGCKGQELDCPCYSVCFDFSLDFKSIHCTIGASFQMVGQLISMICLFKLIVFIPKK